MALKHLPRIRLGCFPTAFEPAPDLGELLGIPELRVKRDDLTGYSWGGNKIRTIEFLLAEAIDLGSDTVVVCGGPTSNFAALMSVACAHHGLAVHRVCHGSAPTRTPAALAVSLQSGALVEFTGSPDRASMEAVADKLVKRLRTRGQNPYLVPRGGATAVGALGFANAAMELSNQLELAGLDAVSIVLPVGCGGTISGLIAGWHYALGEISRSQNFDVEIIGVSVSRAPEILEESISACSAQCAKLAGAERLPRKNVRLRWRLVDGRGGGYGISSARDAALIDKISKRTRFMADATYNSKALGWLADFSTQLANPVVYWHTGGALGVLDRLSGEIISHSDISARTEYSSLPVEKSGRPQRDRPNLRSAAQ